MAKALLIQHNRNDDLNSPNGLTGDSRRFVKFNGGVSENQLRWLDELLRMAQLNEELVIVAGQLHKVCNKHYSLLK
jgi:manganese-dependent ADP-ribose/CDP-alcohol diphosphatase